MIHWLTSGRYSHASWAYLHLNPGFERDDLIHLDHETIDAQDELIRSGWLRVSTLTSIEMLDPDKLSVQAWDAWASMVAPCIASGKSDPEREVTIGYGLESLESRSIYIAEIIDIYCSRKAADSFWRVSMGESIVRGLVRSFLIESMGKNRWF